jgi:hypothetical protein
MPSAYSRPLRSRPLTDITLLRRFSQALAIPPQAFGLTPPDGSQAGRHAVKPKEGGGPRAPTSRTPATIAWPLASRR